LNKQEARPYFKRSFQEVNLVPFIRLPEGRGQFEVLCSDGRLYYKMKRSLISNG